MKKCICPRCKHPGFKLKPWNENYPFKPVFTCDKYEHEWSIGRDGGEFKEHVMNKKEVEEIIKKYREFNLA